MLWCVYISVFYLYTTIKSVKGDIIIKQVQANDQNIKWVIEGLATYEYEGSFPQVYYFDCTSTINNGLGLSWSKIGGLTKSQNSITNGIRLLFSNPTQNDAGIYICSDSASSDSVQLNITTANPAAQAKVNSIMAVVGESVTIQFYASGIPAPQASNITWQQNGVEIISSNFNNNKKQLTIPSIALSDSGIYKFNITYFEYSLSPMTAVAHTTLTVLGSAPNISRITPPTLDILNGQNINLLVIYEGGYPDPDVTWTRQINGVIMDILNDTRASVSGLHGLNLTLVNTTIEDGVVYIVTVTNGAGSVQLQFNVSILVAPLISSITPTTLDILNGQNINLLVIYEGGYPEPNVTWTRQNNGVIIDVLNDTRASVSGQLGLNLTLFNVTTKDGVVYVLTVTNSVGSIQLQFNVSILVAPTILRITPPILDVLIGQNITLLVIYEGGYPDPDVTWTRQFNGVLTDILNDTRASVSGLHGLNLTLVNSTMEDRAVYILTVNNSVSSIQLQFNVSILNPPGSPLNFTLSKINSTAIMLSWIQPLVGEDITNYNLSCYEMINGIFYFVDSFLVVSANRSINVVLNNFRPGTPIDCSVKAISNIRAGKSAFGTTTTYEEAPGGPPRNFSILAAFSHNITVHWLPPDPFLQNGIIINYTLTCHEILTEVTPSSLPRVYPHPPPINVTVEGLTPFTMYNCTVVATNSAGQSKAASDNAITIDNPGPVQGIEYHPISSSVLIVNFTSQALREMILSFEVSIELYVGGEKRMKIINSSQFEVKFTRLGAMIPYNVTVLAINAAGRGKSTTNVIFTEEGVPSPPRNILATRLNGTHMMITWDAIPLKESNGFLTNYSVTYWYKEQHQAQPIMLYVPSNQTTVIIGGLDSTSKYIITVRAATSAGLGESSVNYTVLQYTSDTENREVKTTPLIIIVSPLFGLIILILIIALICTCACIKNKEMIEKIKLSTLRPNSNTFTYENETEEISSTSL